MADVFTKAKRSQVMARIRSRGNRDTELALAKLLRGNGITGWRRHLEIRGRDAALRGATVPAAGSSTVPVRGDGLAARRRHNPQAGRPRHDVPAFRVKPDFVFLKSRTAIFVDGCFWHGCPRHATRPKNNAAFWRRKLADNRGRDRRVNRALRRAGWRVVRIWECALQKRPHSAIKRILRALDRSSAMVGAHQQFQPFTGN